MGVARRISALAASVLAACGLVAACATHGRVYDRAASEAFRAGVTTPDQALAALGPADVDVHRPDGGRVLAWKYRRLTGLTVREYTLSARFDAAGRMIDLHNPEEGQVIDPF